MANPQTPTIGITCIDVQPPDEQHAAKVGQNRSYVVAVAEAGAAPLLIPLVTERALLRALYERLDGLLLSGGEDIDPAHYGEVVHDRCGQISPERDEVEITLTRWAVDDGKPVLAICRGIQVLNVALGEASIRISRHRRSGLSAMPGIRATHAITEHTQLPSSPVPACIRSWA